jgi:hypothetical protein
MELEPTSAVAGPTQVVALRRPLAITVIGCVFIAAGTIGLVYHLFDFKHRTWLDLELALIFSIRLLAIIAGIFLLRGRSWARWLLAGWMAYHIVLSLFHSPVELLMHVLLFGVIGYFLFCPRSTAYIAQQRQRG